MIGVMRHVAHGQEEGMRKREGGAEQAHYYESRAATHNSAKASRSRPPSYFSSVPSALNHLRAKLDLEQVFRYNIVQRTRVTGDTVLLAERLALDVGSDCS